SGGRIAVGSSGPDAPVKPDRPSRLVGGGHTDSPTIRARGCSNWGGPAGRAAAFPRRQRFRNRCRRTKIKWVPLIVLLLPEGALMALTSVDRALLQRCLQHDTGAWNDFVDRFLGLIYHVIHYTSHLRSAPLSPEEVEDIAQEVLLQVVANDYA